MKLLRFNIGDKVKLVVNDKVLKRGEIVEDLENGYVSIKLSDGTNYNAWVADLELDDGSDVEKTYTSTQVCEAIVKALQELGID